MKLSIITINFNNADGLHKTIESVVSQVFTDFEYIVIDGGSADGSVDIIKEYTDKITYWVSEPDKGIYNAMNKGILQAKGEYCLFLNSGDWLVGNNVIECVFTNNQISEDIVVTRWLKGQESRKGIIEFNKVLTFYDFYDASFPHGCTFIKRSLFTDVGLYDENYKIVSDWIFFTEAVIRHECRYQYVDVELCSYEEGGLSSSFIKLHIDERKKYLSNNFRLFYENYQELQFYKNSRLIKKCKQLIENLVLLRTFRFFKR